MRAMLLVFGLFSLLGQVYGQYMSLNITAPFECGALTVQWWGDDGPYHLLITPIRQHSYNVWVPTIDNGTNTYTMTLRQPAGLPFMVTVWGRSGIQFAGSSDIYTVGPATTSNSSCFLSDQEILERYSFSFNITGSRGGFPPQCTNLTMSWPTSLEQSVVGTTARRGLDSGMEFEDDQDLDMDMFTDIDLEEQEEMEESLYPPPGFPRLDPFPMTGLSKRQDRESNPSSSSDSGNTTNPPTMFGLIPLGNSFSLPITYAANSSFADNLPESSISSEPTTFTRQGVTYLNWTLPLAKGTRFILVAGIGTAEQWASGGSSRLLTVGQGDESCLGLSNGDGPSVTANPTNTDAIPTATRPPDDGSTPAPPASKSNSNLVRIVLACVISIVGTLVLVLAFWFYKRWRRQRDAAASLPGKKGRVDPFDPNVGDRSSNGTDTQLDLLGRDGLRLDTTRTGSPIHTIHPYPHGQAGSGSPTSPTDPFQTPIENRHFTYPYPSGIQNQTRPQSAGPSRSSTLDNMSPLGQGSTINRHSSQEALLSHASTTMTPTLRSQTRRLGLHDGSGFGLDEGEEDESTDLKRETLAALEGPSSSASATNTGSGTRTGTGTATPTPTTGRTGTASPTPNALNGRRQRRRQDEEYETEYVVHRDAGRVDRVELPPRYDEVQWEER